MDYRHFNRHLHVDLSSGNSEVRTIGPSIFERYIGGKGIGLWLLTQMDTSDDPFDPGNPLIFTTGPLTGTSIQTSARSAIVTRSPLTGGFLDSHAGGHFGPAMRRAGWDYMSIIGKSNAPAYLLVTPDGMELLDASNLWGLDAFETEAKLKVAHPGSKIAVIGQAGENLVRFAAIGTEEFRHFGRGGAGAVMGSKNLKAVVVSGKVPMEYHDKEEFSRLGKELVAELKNHEGAKYRNEKGTMMWVRMGHEDGHFLPTHNFRDGQFKDYEAISSETMAKELDWSNTGCFGCAVIRCSKVSKWDGKQMEGPEYETTAYLGSGCELSSARDVAEANWLCDKYGLDTISAGVTISFALECAEKGLLTEVENNQLKFGCADSVHSLIEAIAMRSGIGDVLAEGTRLASKKIGQGSEYFAIQVAGMELSGVNPLGSYSMGLALCTSDFASHTRLWTATDEMNGNLDLDTLPQHIKDGQDDTNARNCLIVCDFLPFGLDRLAPFYNAATGLSLTKEKLIDAGARIQSLSRKYTMQKGRTHADDVLPGRFYEEKSFAGLMKGKKISREFMESQIQEIFKLRGWDEDGMPMEK